MKLVITDTIRRLEFTSLQMLFPLEIIKIAAKKSIQGLGENIKNPSKISGTVLKKICLTSTGGAGRAIFLLQISYQKAVLVMTRMKNDKEIGTNMTVLNPKFKKALNKNLDLAINDIESGNFEEYEL